MSFDSKKEFCLSRSVRLAILLVIFLLGTVIRLNGVASAPPHPDERHWVSRSAQVRKHADAGNWSNLTDHLVHPGVPGAVAMGFVQKVALTLRPGAGLSSGISWSDPLTASRIANVGISILSCLAMLLFAPFLGFEVAILAAGLMTFDGQNIGLSRIAHIDMVLVLLTTLCVLSYLYAERYQRTGLKILAGALWGLAISTKPTAAALVGVLVLYRMLRRLTWSSEESRPAWFSWGDVWAVLTGQVVLCLVFTRLWDAKNMYISVYKLHPALSRWIESFAEFLESSPSVIWAMSLCLCVLIGWLLVRSRGSRDPQQFGWRHHLSMFVAIVGALLVLTGWFPVVSANLVRFWAWVIGLSAFKHEAYGMVDVSYSQGYLELLFRRMSSVLFVGIVLAIGLIVTRWNKRIDNRFGEEQALLLLCLVAPFVWILPLSLSSKQSIRYVAPILPLWIVLASWAFVQVISWVLSRWTQFSKVPRRAIGSSFVAASLFLSPLAVELARAVSVRPHYDSQFNIFSGGIHSADRKDWTLGFVGYDKALKIVYDEAVSTGNLQRLEIFGDYALMKFAYSRYYPDSKDQVEIIPFGKGFGSDWVLSFEAFERLKRTEMASFAHLQPAFTYQIKGVDVYSLYKTSLVDLTAPTALHFHHGARETGRGKVSDDGIGEIEVNPKRAREGFMSFAHFIRLSPGKYRLSVPARIPEWAQGRLQHFQPDAMVLRIEFGLACVRNILFKELTLGTAKVFDLDCDISSSERIEVRNYWYGGVPLRLREPVVQKIEAH